MISSAQNDDDYDRPTGSGHIFHRLYAVDHETPGEVQHTNFSNLETASAVTTSSARLMDVSICFLPGQEIWP